ncbi:flippase [Myroides odoratus]
MKNMSSLTLIQLANYAVPLILIPYISRIVGVENYGKLEYARVFVLYFTVLIDYGFNYTATREISLNRENKEQLNKIFTQVILCKVLLFIVATLIFYSLIYTDESLYEVRKVLWMTYIINVGFVFFPIWFFQGIEKIAFVSIVNFVIKIGVLALVIFLLRDKSSYWVYNLLQSLAQVLAGGYAFYLVIKRYKVRLVKVSLAEIGSRFKEGLAVFISTLLVSVIASFSFIIMKQYVSEAELGVYSTAFKLVITIQTILLVPFSQSFFPYMSGLFVRDIPAFRQKMKKAAQLLILLNLGIALFSFVFAEWIIKLLFGEEYLDATIPFQCFLFLPLFACLTNLYSYQGLLNMKKDKVFLGIHIVFALLTIGLSYLVIPKMGLYGTIGLRVVLEFGLFILSLFFYRKYIVKVCP